MFKKLSLVSLVFLFILVAAFNLFKHPIHSQKQQTDLKNIPFLAQSTLSSTIGKDQSAYYFSSTHQGYTNHHPTQKYEIHLNQEGLKVEKGIQEWGLKLTGLGDQNSLQKLSHPILEVKKNRVEYRYSSDHEKAYPEVTVWYENGPLGLQQGVTIQSPLASKENRSKLILQLDQLGNSSSELKNQQLQIKNSQGKELFRYAGLIAYDANGKKLPVEMRLRSSKLFLEVDDREAAYPIVVDPFIQIAELTASDGAAGDQLSYSVAISGSTIVAGAPTDVVDGNTQQGSVYVFNLSNGIWSETQKLLANDGAADNVFGISVAIEDSTIVVGAAFADIGGNNSQGAAYVFNLSNGTWSQTQKLVADDGAAGDDFGMSVAIKDSTIVVGAPFVNFGGNNNQGTAYVFNLSNGNWSQTQEIVANNGAADDNFGKSLAIEDSTIVVGAYLADISGNADQGAAYIFNLSNGDWSQAQEIVANNGAAGDYFGYSVAIKDSTIVAGAYLADVSGNANQGAAYIFNLSNGNWSQTQELVSSNGVAGDNFGISVAIDDSTIVAGAQGVDINGNADQGASYIFNLSNGSWSQTQELAASNGGVEYGAGFAVAIDHVTIVMDSNSTVNGNDNQGSVYVFADVNVRVDPTTLSLTSSGTPGNYTLVLTVQPSSDVIVTVHPPTSLILNSNTFTFTSSNWSTPQMVQVTAGQDALGSLTISHTAASTDTNYNGINISPVMVVVSPPGGCSMTNLYSINILQFIIYFLSMGVLFVFRRFQLK